VDESYTPFISDLFNPFSFQCHVLTWPNMLIHLFTINWIPMTIISFSIFLFAPLAFGSLKPHPTPKTWFWAYRSCSSLLLFHIHQYNDMIHDVSTFHMVQNDSHSPHGKIGYVSMWFLKTSTNACPCTCFSNSINQRIKHNKNICHHNLENDTKC
jgi:hypothetical protein